MKTIGVSEKIDEMHRIKKNIFLNMYKILKIGVKVFTDAKVHTITIDNRRLFWVKMYDMQETQR